MESYHIAVGGGIVSQRYIEWFNLEIRHSVISNKLWWNFTDCDQKLCEMVPIALMFVMNRKDTWDTYTSDEKRILVDWMSKCNEFRIVDNNWNFFPLIVNSVLKSLGESYNETKIRNAWKKIDSFYLGNGWYKDGESGLVDYYVAFAFHFYPLVMLKANLLDDERRKIVISRAQEFSKTYVLFEDKDGRYVPYGRSLCYRTAQSAFWSGIAINGIETPADGYVKDLICDNIGFWFENQTIIDESGLLNIGYEYGNQIMSDEYNSYGSPYWAMKGFMILCLGENDPFWHNQKPQRKKYAGTYTTPIGVIARSVDETEVALYPVSSKNPTLVNGLSKYNKFVYSSRFGFSIPRSYNSCSNSGLDCMLTVQISEGLFLPADRISSVHLNDSYIERISDIVPGLRVRSIIIPENTFHIRIHLIENQIGEIIFYDGGFSVPAIDAFENKENEVVSVDGEYRSKVKTVTGHGKYQIVTNAPNSNIRFSQSKVPVAVYKVSSEKSVIATLVVGGTINDRDPEVSVVLEEETIRILMEKKSISIPVKNENYIVEKNKEPITKRAKGVIKKLIKGATNG
ncbi:MAG: DUF2264 domain-containing protein [Prevotellaceae bacterium]|nr:DUF2264 domain-containing protein [Prevotellaceae bacterium]